MTLDGVTLPDGLRWVDEYAWTPVSQTVAVSLTGTLIVQEAAQQAGRPITLAAAGGDSCWVTRAELDVLFSMTQDAGRTMVLELDDGSTRNVIWRRDQQPIDAYPVLEVTDPDDSTLYVLATLRLTEV